MLPQPLQTRVAKAILLNQHENIVYDRVRLSTINYVIRMLSFDMGLLAQLVTLSVSESVTNWRFDFSVDDYYKTKITTMTTETAI